jgi:hypothetical protein
MKRPKASPASKGKTVVTSDAEFLKRYPVLTQWMTDGKWDDGKPREVSTLSVNLKEGVVNLGLSDHEAQASLYTTAGTLQEALEQLEAALRDETGAWRPWKAGKGRK